MSLHDCVVCEGTGLDEDNVECYACDGVGELVECQCHAYCSCECMCGAWDDTKCDCWDY